MKAIATRVRRGMITKYSHRWSRQDGLIANVLRLVLPKFSSVRFLTISAKPEPELDVRFGHWPNRDRNPGKPFR